MLKYENFFCESFCFFLFLEKNLFSSHNYYHYLNCVCGGLRENKKYEKQKLFFPKSFQKAKRNLHVFFLSTTNKQIQNHTQDTHTILSILNIYGYTHKSYCEYIKNRGATQTMMIMMMLETNHIF
mgnify:CR=1 FL=1